MGRIYEIVGIRSGIDSDEEIQALVEVKKQSLDALIADCRAKEYKHVVSYLENAKNDLFTGITNKLQGKTTSRIERIFRTVNMRINVSKWTTKGALNVTMVRLAFYYNGFDPENSENPYPGGLNSEVSTSL